MPPVLYAQCNIALLYSMRAFHSFDRRNSTTRTISRCASSNRLAIVPWKYIIHSKRLQMVLECLSTSSEPNFSSPGAEYAESTKVHVLEHTCNLPASTLGARSSRCGDMCRALTSVVRRTAGPPVFLLHWNPMDHHPTLHAAACAAPLNTCMHHLWEVTKLPCLCIQPCGLILQQKQNLQRMARTLKEKDALELQQGGLLVAARWAWR